MNMMLLLFLDNVRSERELMRIIPERLDYLWFLGLWLGRRGSESQRLEQSPQALISLLPLRPGSAMAWRAK